MPKNQLVVKDGSWRKANNSSNSKGLKDTTSSIHPILGRYPSGIS
jgi:hypothetical protein